MKTLSRLQRVSNKHKLLSLVCMSFYKQGGRNEIKINYYPACYGDNVSGSITLTSIPTKKGDYLTGTFKTSAMIRYKPERKIEMDVKINIRAGKQTFYECK